MSKKLYKLTNEKSQTLNNTQWGPQVEHTASGEGELCGPGWLHAYEDPLLAVLLNPVHSNFSNPKLWECEGKIGKRDGQLKVGCTRLKTIRQIPLPKITTKKRIKFAILCALAVCDLPAFVVWAKDWLAGKNRSKSAAAAAEAEAEAWTAAWAALAAAAAPLAAARAAAEAEAEAEAWAAAAAEAAEAEAEANVNKKFSMKKLAKQATI